MRHLLLALMLLLPVAAASEEGAWVPMNDDEIRNALTERTLQYANARQSFYASGRTLYNAGRDSWGYWRVQNDSYCSQWPPSDLWACFKMDRKGTMLRFVGAGDDITEAVYLD
ncbi:hypothetical protein [Sulfitobacter aestuariivivens]|uniref:Secreted protein n=1 Tax=Sulfitobacter aestuariivivens TaxID=2766981 RepID=A0A927HF31_9RHOB|nr:hypothetical protein [Sulfitobacter aestuariivivens]MBD3664511.1 hypothetical protein [Sulfitobacter aestuariivivens]